MCRVRIILSNAALSLLVMSIHGYRETDASCVPEDTLSPTINCSRGEKLESLSYALRQCPFEFKENATLDERRQFIRHKLTETNYWRLVALFLDVIAYENDMDDQKSVLYTQFVFCLEFIMLEHDANLTSTLNDMIRNNFIEPPPAFFVERFNFLSTRRLVPSGQFLHRQGVVLDMDPSCAPAALSRSFETPFDLFVFSDILYVIRTTPASEIIVSSRNANVRSYTAASFAPTISDIAWFCDNAIDDDDDDEDDNSDPKTINKRLLYTNAQNVRRVTNYVCHEQHRRRRQRWTTCSSVDKSGGDGTSSFWWWRATLAIALIAIIGLVFALAVATRTHRITNEPSRHLTSHDADNPFAGIHFESPLFPKSSCVYDGPRNVPFTNVDKARLYMYDVPRATPPQVLTTFSNETSATSTARILADDGVASL